VSDLESNVPFQHKHGYIKDEQTKKKATTTDNGLIKKVHTCKY